MTSSLSHNRQRRCWAEIDLAALRHNFAVARAQAGEGVKVMAVVKANAYGHGVGPVVRALADSADYFGLANVEEAREVRAHLPAAELFILGPALPEERAEIVAGGFTASVSNVEEGAAFAALAGTQPMPVHLVIDTGMGRIGTWQDEALETARALAQMPGLEIAGIASHLPSADEDEAFTREQLARFHRLVSALRDAGIRAPLVHVENSAGLLGFPSEAGNMVRAGLMLYGSSPLPEWQPKLQPVLTWKARVTLVRDLGAGRGVSYGRTFITPGPMRVATLGVGYADGFQRHLTNRNAEVLIGGHRCSLLGRVTMDQIIVDVTAVPDVVAGAEAVLIGRQGDEEILASEVAAKAGTIPWEIFTGIGRRVERVVISD